jgi:nucleotidyltransferase/DNA polymerase involved in DNA repair
VLNLKPTSRQLQKSTPTIFHVDMDAFFASVEEAENPALRGKALIIGGKAGQRGVVSTCSYEARRYGVHSAMSLFEADRRCPHAIFMPGNYALYRTYSDKIMQIFQVCTPYVEAVSIDEAYLDVTAEVSLYGGPYALAQLLRAIIARHIKLTCSIGIATNKMMAKIASQACKPNGVLLIPEGQEATFLAPLPIDTIPGIGKKTTLTMQADGFDVISKLQDAGIDRLMQLYGSSGYHYYHAACGKDHRAVQWEDTPPKSIGAEITFDQDQVDLPAIQKALATLCHKVWRRLRSQKMRASALLLKLRNHTFHTITRSISFGCHTNDETEILSAATALLEGHYATQLPLRLIGISLEKLSNSYWQPTFWSDQQANDL